MNKKDIFKGFIEKQQEAYAQKAREKYDPQLVDNSMKRWKNYSPEKQKEIIMEGSAIYQEIFDSMDKGADSSEVQGAVAKWHQTAIFMNLQSSCSGDSAKCTKTVRTSGPSSNSSAPNSRNFCMKRFSCTARKKNKSAVKKS
ncbi:MAG: TipAS antibiotic-recognition domain-containing protein [Candidatus Aminicenantes bacterium]|nr:TipAS antibiotic-recognition domain-containing protein [Candidatus Aminicenantes bacterium]